MVQNNPEQHPASGPEDGPSKVFDSPGEWKAFEDAVCWLKEAGFSVGRMQRGSPIGVLFGEYDIQKWRNLSKTDRANLDGKIIGYCREGPVTVRLTPAAWARIAPAHTDLMVPPEALDAYFDGAERVHAPLGGDRERSEPKTSDPLNGGES